MALIFIHLLAYVLGKQISYQFNANKLNTDNWVDNLQISLCQEQYILRDNGKLNMGSTIMSNFELLPHFRIYIDLVFYRIDSWDSDQFQIYLDNKKIYDEAFTNINGRNLCGSSLFNDEIIQISVQAQHTSNLAVIFMHAQDVNNDNDGSWGISSFTLSIEPCPKGCDYCESNSLMQCQYWSLQYWDQQFTHWLYQNDKVYQVQNHNQFCQYNIALPSHNKVMIRFRIFIQFGFNLNFNVSILQSNSLNLILTSTSIQGQFLDIVLPFFNHIQNQIQVQIERIGGTYTHLDIKDFQVLIQKDENQQQGYFNLILTQNNCINFENGWNQILQDGIDQIFCLTICGNSITEGFEECDDGNNDPFDGCYNCYFQCSIDCKQCKFGKCLECQLGYNLNNNKCEPICGDGIIIAYFEQCDDQNLIQGDGCNDCKLECPISDQQFPCLSCQIGLNYEECFPFCGDKVVELNYEDCDDGNDEQYDGCFQCKYQCNINCNNCTNGICYDECNYGEVMVNNNCISMCGNEIISGQEDCDDGNDIQYDGCYECKYSCPFLCNQCNEGICQECQQPLILMNNQCIENQTCGNNIIENNEQCDDGNFEANDGCYKCQIEYNWICNYENHTQCAFTLKPQKQLRYLNQTFSFQYAEFPYYLKINSKLRLLDQQPNISSKIINCPQNKYKIIEYQQSDNNQIQDQYIIILSIEITQQMTERPILQIDLDDDLANQNTLISKTQQLTLLLPRYLSPQQKNIAQKLANINKIIIYCQFGISFLSLFQGESSVVQEVLNTLQYLSLLKFINVQYPENVYIFFQFSDLISINPFLDLIHFNNYIIYPQSEGFVLNGKFAFYQIDANLLKNLTCQILQIIGLLILLLVIKILEKQTISKNKLNNYFNCINYLKKSCNQSLLMFITKSIHYIIQKTKNMSKLFSLEGVKQFFLLNGIDLLFKIFLYFSSRQINNENYIYLIISIFLIATYLIILFIQYEKYLYFSREREKKLELFKELIILIRYIIFLIILVFVQDNQILQTNSILVINLSYVIILYNIQKRIKSIKIISLIIESSVVLFTLTSISYFDDYDKFISYEKRIIVGFAQIGMLMLCLLIQLLSQIIPKGKKMMTIIAAKLLNRSSQQKVELPQCNVLT